MKKTTLPRVCQSRRREEAGTRPGGRERRSRRLIVVLSRYICVPSRAGVRGREVAATAVVDHELDEMSDERVVALMIVATRVQHHPGMTKTGD